MIMRCNQRLHKNYLACVYRSESRSRAPSEKDAKEVDHKDGRRRSLKDDVTRQESGAREERQAPSPVSPGQLCLQGPCNVGWTAKAQRDGIWLGVEPLC